MQNSFEVSDNLGTLQDVGEILDPTADSFEVKPGLRVADARDVGVITHSAGDRLHDDEVFRGWDR